MKRITCSFAGYTESYLYNFFILGNVFNLFLWKNANTSTCGPSHFRYNKTSLAQEAAHLWWTHKKLSNNCSTWFKSNLCKSTMNTDDSFLCRRMLLLWCLQKIISNLVCFLDKYHENCISDIIIFCYNGPISCKHVLQIKLPIQRSYHDWNNSTATHRVNNLKMNPSHKNHTKVTCLIITKEQSYFRFLTKIPRITWHQRASSQ